MKHLFSLLFFLSAFARTQEPTPAQVDLMQEEMSCSDGDYSTNILVVEENSGSSGSSNNPLVGAKILLKPYSGKMKEFTSDLKGDSGLIPLMLCDTVIVSKNGYSTLTFISGELFPREDLPLWTIRLPIDSSSSTNTSLTNDDTFNNTENLSKENVPVDIESGYKGFLWGMPVESNISNNFTLLQSVNSQSSQKSFSGNLGIDSVLVTYAFADSGFWKVEIDFITDQKNLDSQISHFRRLEKNISAVYGPPANINQKESGVSSVFSDQLNQKFSRALYRSSWDANPVIIELYLNGNVLLPKTDLVLFSGNFSILKLVYYNPDYMHSSHELPNKEILPSIFDIY